MKKEIKTLQDVKYYVIDLSKIDNIEDLHIIRIPSSCDLSKTKYCGKKATHVRVIYEKHLNHIEVIGSCRYHMYVNTIYHSNRYGDHTGWKFTYSVDEFINNFDIIISHFS